MDVAVSVAEWLLGRQKITAATSRHRADRSSELSGRQVYREPKRRRRNTPLRSRRNAAAPQPDEANLLPDRRLGLRLAPRRLVPTENRLYRVGEVHPFGSHFILAQWSPVENWAADQVGRKPYRRIPMTITEIGPAAVRGQRAE